LKNDVNVASKSNNLEPDPESDPIPNPDLLVRGTDPHIRIRTKMSQIRNTGEKKVLLLRFGLIFPSGSLSSFLLNAISEQDTNPGWFQDFP
jgi:hypothetical protein